MSDEVYILYCPNGDTYKNKNLQAFCDEYNTKVSEDEKVCYDGMRKACKAGKEYKGWIIEKTTEDALADIDISSKPEVFGLTSEEKILKLSEENSRLKSQVKENMRSSSLFKELADIITSRQAPTYVPELLYKEQTGKINESAVLVLSDLHSDLLIKSERVNDCEEYNFNSFCRRAEKLVETTIKHLTQNLKGYSFETLYIFSLGDNIQGLIHNSQQHTEWANCLKSSVACGTVISKMILDLSQYFKKIVYIGLSGNHPRLDIGKKDYRGAHLNFDWLVNAEAKKQCKALVDTGRVEFAIPDSWSTVVNIFKYNFHLSHGDTLTGCSLGIPFYALQRRSYRLAALGAVNGVVPHYQIIGHYHNQSSMKQTVGELIVNGAFPATDEFAYHGLSLFNEPSQLLFGVHPNHGKTWEMPILLREKDWREFEKKRSRYNKDLF